MNKLKFAYYLTVKSLSFIMLSFITHQLIAFSSEQNISTGNEPGKYRDKFVNIRSNPFYFILGGFNIEADFNLSPTFTLGPKLTYFNTSIFNDEGFDNLTATILGVQMNKFFSDSSQYDSWFIKSHISYLTAEYDYYETRGRGNESYRLRYFERNRQSTSWILGLGVGYQWMWEHFNIRTGAGFDFILMDEVEKLIKSAAIDFSLGWAF